MWDTTAGVVGVQTNIGEQVNCASGKRRVAHDGDIVRPARSDASVACNTPAQFFGYMSFYCLHGVILLFTWAKHISTSASVRDTRP